MAHDSQNLGLAQLVLAYVGPRKVVVQRMLGIAELFSIDLYAIEHILFE